MYGKCFSVSLSMLCEISVAAYKYTVLFTQGKKKSKILFFQNTL